MSAVAVAVTVVMLMVVIMLMVMAVIAMFAVMVIVAAVGSVHMARVIMTAVRPMYMALGGLLFSQQRSTPFTHIGIGIGIKLIHAGQHSKSHCLQSGCCVIATGLGAGKLYKILADLYCNLLTAEIPHHAKKQGRRWGCIHMQFCA